jgi:hypothetical protein
VPAAAAIATAFMTGSDSALTMIARACGCVALGLLGPGAYSIDANVFGRRVIRLEPRGPDRASDAQHVPGFSRTEADRRDRVGARLQFLRARRGDRPHEQPSWS